MGQCPLPNPHHKVLKGLNALYAVWYIGLECIYVL